MVNDIALALPFASLVERENQVIGTPRYQVKRTDRAYGAVDDLCSLAITVLHLIGCPLDPNPAAADVLDQVNTFDGDVLSARVRELMVADLRRAQALGQQTVAVADPINETEPPL